MFFIRHRCPVLVGMFIMAACLVFPGCAGAVSKASPVPIRAAGAPAKTWYFAEGTTRAGFKEYVCLLNPGGEVSIARFTYMLAGGQTIERAYDLLPRSRTTINVASEVPAESDVSIVVNATEPVIAERPMYFTYKGAWSGGHDVMGAGEPLSQWYFAEGTTRNGFDTYLCLQNPGSTEASVDVDYFLTGGTTVSRKGIKIAPRSRYTIAAHDENLGIGRHDDASGDFSARVRTSAQTPVVAERATYFNYRPYVNGGHDVVGAAAPGLEWYFAEGTTRSGFDSYICLANPGSKEAKVNVTYFCGDGTAVEKKDIAIGRRSRFTIAAHDENLGIGRHDDPRGDFSAKVEVTNGVGVVAERPIYYTYRPFWTGGSDTVGATAPATEWNFAEGTTRHGFDTYLCLANPGGDRAVVDITYFRGDNRQEIKSGIEIAPRSRLTIAVHDGDRGIGRRDDSSGDVSTKIVSRNGVPILAERPMYFAARWRTMDKNAIAAARGWGELTRGNKSRPQVALTFDCEYGPSPTSSLLDILKQKGVSATCFLCGRLAASPDVMVRIAAEGHELANHGTSHPQFTKISSGQVVSELANVEGAVNRATGLSTKPYFRFPYGERNGGLIGQVNSLGYLSMFWSVDPQEWRASATVQGVIDNVVGTSGPGAIVLMHDDAKSIQALPAIIDGLRARGYSLVTLTEVLYPGP
jgi:peptidoglycan/xylan/chitin deacetylase (PgdA/CDA1 family)